jgi:hypothetical protein
MRHAIEIIVASGAVLIGVIVCLFVGGLLVQEVRRGVRGRFSATVIYALTSPIMGAVPLIIALGARWLGAVGGIALFSTNGGNDGNLTGVGFIGFVIAFGATVLFAAVMLVQALIRSGGSNGADRE